MHRKISRLVICIFCTCNVQAQEVKNFARAPLGASSFKLFDMRQQKVISLDAGDKTLSLFVFLSPECPLSQNYSATINQLQADYGKKVNIYGIIPGDAYTKEEVHQFEKKYRTTFRILIDPKKQLTSSLDATVTPQAIILDSLHNIIYTGAIDDWITGLGKKRLQPSKHYVRDAIQQSLQSTIVKTNRTDVFGCKINDY